MKVLPGRMAEYIELQKKMFDIAKRIGGMPSWRRLSLVSGEDDHHQTVTYLIEFDSFAAMDNFIKMAENAEMQAVMTKLDHFIESHQHAVYIDTPVPLDHG